MTDRATHSPDTQDDWFFITAILVVTAVAYTPLIRGVVELGAQTAQSLNAVVLLGITLLDAWVSVRRVAEFRPAINRHGLFLLGLSCLALAAASLSGVALLSVLGLCLNLGALLSFGFGRRGCEVFYPALAGVGVTVSLLVAVPQADLYLRWFAGRMSAFVLPFLGIRAEMLVQQAPFQILLVAEHGAGVFNVATECNGVGIIVSSVLVALVLSLRRGLRWFLWMPLMAVSFVLGLLFNSVRIVAIAVAALTTAWPYKLIHEGLGTVVYLVALATVFLLVRVVPSRR